MKEKRIIQNMNRRIKKSVAQGKSFKTKWLMTESYLRHRPDSYMYAAAVQCRAKLMRQWLDARGMWA